jgi:hypothetical protein
VWPDLTIAVNVSSLQFRRINFVEVVKKILKETRFNPTRLELELTESVLLGNVDMAEAVVVWLKALGVRLALDDLGTSYSSLLYLAPLSVRQTQDRPQFRAIDREGRRCRGHRPRDCQPRPRPRHAGHRRRRGDGRPAALPARRRRSFDAGLPLRQAGDVAEISMRLQSPAAFRPVEVTALAS